MIYKSYLIENNIDMLKNKITLFYGENIGLLDDFKNLIINKKKGEILSFHKMIFYRSQNNLRMKLQILFI